MTDLMRDRRNRSRLLLQRRPPSTRHNKLDLLPHLDSAKHSTPARLEPRLFPRVRLARSSRRLRDCGTAHRGPIFRFCVPGSLCATPSSPHPHLREAAARHRTARTRPNQLSVRPEDLGAPAPSISAPRNRSDRVVVCNDRAEPHISKSLRY